MRKLRILNISIHYPTENSFTSPSEEVVYACINPPKEAVESGKAISLARGKFDIRNILAKLPSNWYPELISISSSLALIENPPIPIGLQNVNFQSVMKLTDSHHMHRPIQNLIEYSKMVGCSYHWTSYNRQHIHFYREAGLANVFWMPGSMNILPYEIKPVSLNKKNIDVIFLGSRGSTHPHRNNLLEFLEKSNINVTIKRFPYKESLQTYATSKIVLNCSLNGDFNRRVFETLMAGGFLITDRLAPESGLPLIFKEGEHLELYSSKQELLEK
ncbi:MAG: glycosyltransferase family 1 protein, partial [Moorea sp. SIO4A3]|nr:glycosyltransferase family 1 protein [Moorena sp. SIO4A3]